MWKAAGDGRIKVIFLGSSWQRKSYEHLVLHMVHPCSFISHCSQLRHHPRQDLDYRLSSQQEEVYYQWVSLCVRDAETVNHLLLNCDTVREVWLKSFFGTSQVLGCDIAFHFEYWHIEFASPAGNFYGVYVLGLSYGHLRETVLCQQIDAYQLHHICCEPKNNLLGIGTGPVCHCTCKKIWTDAGLQ